jgi:hypothetical protein
MAGQEWINGPEEIVVQNLSMLASPEILSTTSRKHMDLINIKNITKVTSVIQKSITNSQNKTTWTDSGT